MADTLKNHGALGALPVAFSVPAKPCTSLSPDERTRCSLAHGHTPLTHQGYPSTSPTVLTSWSK